MQSRPCHPVSEEILLVYDQILITHWCIHLDLIFTFKIQVYMGYI